jgi:hypothetical protein
VAAERAGTQLGCQRGSSRRNQVAAFVVPDQDRIKCVAALQVAADDEFLSAIGAPFQPVGGTLIRAVAAADALGDDSLEFQAARGL